MILSIFKLISSVTFLSLTLAGMTIAAATLALKLTTTSAEVARLAAKVAAHAVPQTREARLRAEVNSLETEVKALKARLNAAAKERQRELARLKAKSRLKRMVVAVPLVGLGVAAYFEKQELSEWLLENPGKTEADYACEVGMNSAEVLDEVLAAVPEDVIAWLPESIVPSPDAMQSLFADCKASGLAEAENPAQ